MIKILKNTLILKDIYKGDYDACLSKIESAIQSQKDKDAMTFRAPEFIQTTITVEHQHG